MYFIKVLGIDINLRHYFFQSDIPIPSSLQVDNTTCEHVPFDTEESAELSECFPLNVSTNLL